MRLPRPPLCHCPGSQWPPHPRYILPSTTPTPTAIIPRFRPLTISSQSSGRPLRGVAKAQAVRADERQGASGETGEIRERRARSLRGRGRTSRGRAGWDGGGGGSLRRWVLSAKTEFSAPCLCARLKLKSEREETKCRFYIRVRLSLCRSGRRKFPSALFCSLSFSRGV